MNGACKVISTTCCFALFFLLTGLPVSASAAGATATPIPNFKGHNAEHVGRSRLPYYGANVVVEQYLYGGRYYSEDVVSRQVVEIVPASIVYKTDPTFSAKQLRDQAEEFVSLFLGDDVKLKSLYYESGSKIGTYFFRWLDKSKYLDNGEFAFIQVGLSQNGDFLNFVNTLPFGHEALHLSGDTAHLHFISHKFAAAGQVYANGGSNWRVLGEGWAAETGGWSAAYASGCKGTACDKFYWSTVFRCPVCYVNGVWRPRPNASTRVAVFIPATHASASVHYLIEMNDGSSYVKVVDQNIFFNVWVDIASTSQPGIRRVELDNFFGSQGLDVAWDEIWVYNP